jgi:hypothetical protein
MYCEDCGKKGITFKSNLTGSVSRCSDCDSVAEKKHGINRVLNLGVYVPKEFKPYELKNGPLYKLPNDWRGIDGKKETVRIESKAHEKSTLEAMECRMAETGEVIRKTTFYNKGNQTTPKVFSFGASYSRKASSCQ